jgi:hypothetical protein
LHNYFIMHDIKYFFLNKINQTIRGGQLLHPPLAVGGGVVL